MPASLYPLLLLLFTCTLGAQSSATFVSVQGSAMFNDHRGQPQNFGGDEWEIVANNGAFALGVDRRWLGQRRWSFETGLHYGVRNLQSRVTLAGEVRGRTALRHIRSLAVPFRAFRGVAAARRTDRNLGSGLYVGGLLRYHLSDRGDVTTELHRAVSRATRARFVPNLLVGGRTHGRLLNFSFEFCLPLRSEARVEYGGQTYGFTLRELYLSVGVGHTLR